MKKNTITWLLALAPFFGFSQAIKANVYDKFLKRQRVETEALSIMGLAGKTKLSLDFSATGSTLYLNLSGAGWGTTTVDNGDELQLLFTNDSVVTLKSTGLQGFEPNMLQNSYRHQYLVAPHQLDAFAKYSLAGIRKYSFAKFTDLRIPQQNAAKFNKLSTLFLSELKKTGIFRSVQQINVRDIRNHIGDSIEFCSKVYRTRYFEESIDGPTLLDVQADFSDPFVNVVILQKDREKFNGAPEKKYLDKEVCISGVLTLRNNVPYLPIYNREQIKVKSPVDLTEIDLFVGDSITVTGQVFTARYLEDSKTKPTLLNVGAPYPDQPLTLVIENADRKNFTDPEKAYLNKTLRVSGRVEQFKGQPQIALRKPEQVQVLAGAEPQPTLTALKSETTEIAKAGKQVAKEVVVTPKTAPVVKKPPVRTPAEFPGGDSAFLQFIQKNINLPEALATGEEKKVILSFEVDEKGVWRDMRLVTSAGKDLDKELVKVLKRMPKWNPATQKGVPISSQVTYPVIIPTQKRNEKQKAF